MNPYHLIEKRIAPHYKEELSKLAPFEFNEHASCDCCGRQAVNFNNQGCIVETSYQPLRACTACAIVSVQNPNFLGYEKNDQKSAYKLSGFKGGYLVVPSDESKLVELWIGGKYLDRVKSKPFLSVRDLTGNRAKVELLQGDTSERLVIELSLRRELFMQRLKMSNPHQLNIVSESGVTPVILNDFNVLLKAFNTARETLNNSKIEALIGLLKKYKQGQMDITHPVLVKALHDVPSELLSAIQETSQQPASFLFLLDVIKTIK